MALQRGPIMYCAEWADNNGKTSNIILPSASGFIAGFKPGLLNGVMTLRTEAPVVTVNNDESVTTERRSITLVPYYSWANRGKGEMTVWFPAWVKDVELLSR